MSDVFRWWKECEAVGQAESMVTLPYFYSRHPTFSITVAVLIFENMTDMTFWNTQTTSKRKTLYGMLKTFSQNLWPLNLNSFEGSIWCLRGIPYPLLRSIGTDCILCLRGVSLPINSVPEYDIQYPHTLSVSWVSNHSPSPLTTHPYHLP